jgi:hypothetical protein
MKIEQRKRNSGETHNVLFIDVPLFVAAKSFTRLRNSLHERRNGRRSTPLQIVVSILLNQAKKPLRIRCNYTPGSAILNERKGGLASAGILQRPDKVLCTYYIRTRGKQSPDQCRMKFHIQVCATVFKYDEAIIGIASL